MAEHSITQIMGIGPVIEKAFAVHGITTVKQLAELEPGEMKIPNLNNLITRARTYLKAAVDPTPQQGEVVVLGKLGKNKLQDLFSSKLKKIIQKEEKKDIPVESNETKVEPSNELKESKETKEEEENKYLIQDHSWWEMKIVLPTPGTEEKSSLKEAIIYELSVEPHNRISFVCSWVLKEKNEEKLCTMTYSPQFIYYFNLGLPPLEVSVQKDDFNVLPNHEVLQNLLWETNLMCLFSNSAPECEDTF